MNIAPWTIERSATSGRAIGVMDANGQRVMLCSGIGTQVFDLATLTTEAVVHAVNSHAALVEALKEAQAVLVLLTDPQEQRTTRRAVHSALADAVAAELKCRNALAQAGEKFV